MEKKKLTYEEALKELETLVAKIEDPEHSLSTISEDVKRAMDLIRICKAFISGTEEKLNKIIDEKQ